MYDKGGSEVVWIEEFEDGNQYIIMNTNDVYYMYRLDVRTSQLMAPDDGKYYTTNRVYYAYIKNAQIHSEISPAILCPGGLNTFKPGEKIEHYCLYGRIVSKKSWLSWVKDSPYWEQAKVNILGKNE
jgi:hypothetical protein